MGVAKLWEELEPGCSISCWSQLAEPAFAASAGSGVRGLRVGVDLSGWLFHMGRMNSIMDDDGAVVNPGKCVEQFPFYLLFSTSGFFAQQDEADPTLTPRNADLRMVFFRLCALLSKGVLPIFIFDGPHRPSWKRGHRVGGNVFGGRKPADLKAMFELFGVEWRAAPGEAEAELAAMNRRGEIDVVLSVRFAFFPVAATY
jgi:Holliday junction resolvase YEN1